MKRSRKRKNHILILFIVIVVSFLYQNDFSLKNIEKKTISVLSMNDTEESVSKETFTKAAVIRVVDGDTLVAYVDGTEQKIRLIGIDTPESVHPDASKNTQEGIDASNYTKSLITDGQIVYLEKDVSDTDQYGRLLRYVWLQEPDKITQEEIESKMLNAILVKNGYAKVKTFEPDHKYEKNFLIIK